MGITVSIVCSALGPSRHIEIAPESIPDSGTGFWDQNFAAEAIGVVLRILPPSWMT